MLMHLDSDKIIFQLEEFQSCPPILFCIRGVNSSFN